MPSGLRDTHTQRPRARPAMVPLRVKLDLHALKSETHKGQRPRATPAVVTLRARLAMQCGHHTCEGVDEQAHKGTRAVICAPLPQQQGSGR